MFYFNSFRLKVGAYVVLIAMVSQLLHPLGVSAKAGEFYPTLEQHLEAYEDFRKQGFLIESALTTVKADSPSGQKVLRVAATANFVVGQPILIDEGGDNEELHTIASIQEGVSLTLQNNLAFAHSAASAHVVLQRPTPPPLTDEEKREVIFAFELKQYEVSFQIYEAAVEALKDHYRANLRPTHVAAGFGSEQVVDQAIADVKEIVNFGKQHIKSAKTGDILTEAGRAKITDRARINGAAAEAASAHLANAVGALIAEEELRVWFNDTMGRPWGWQAPVRTLRGKLQKGAFHVIILDHKDEHNVFIKSHLNEIKDNFKTWADTAAALASLNQAKLEHDGYIEMLDFHWGRARWIARAQVVLAIVGCFATALQVANAVKTITASPALQNLFVNAGRGQMGGLTFAPAGAGFANLGTVAVATRTVNLVAAHELTGLVAVRAVAAAGGVAIATNMMTSANKGIPSKNLQPMNQNPNFPKNSKANDYPDVKYPQGHPKAGQRMEFPGFDNLKEVPKAQRANWSAPGPKTGPIKGRRAYIREWEKRFGKESPPPGGWGDYAIHHIRPLMYGGENTWENLLPVLKRVHEQQINPWWASFKPGL